MDELKKKRAVRILFVCSGNTCRSPMAKFIMDMESQSHGVPVVSDSAGLYSTQNAPINLLAKNALERLYNREFMHYSKPVNEALLRKADFVFTFTAEQLADLRTLFPKYARKMYRIAKQDIEDPFGGDQAIYDYTAQKIREAVLDILEKLKRKL